MDIYDYLKEDHKKVAKLFDLFTHTEDPKYQLEIFYMIRKELVLHAESEQATFYKILESHSDSREVAEHGEKEHDQIERLIAELSKSKTATESWRKKVLELKLLVEHHVKDEESKMFREAKKVLTDTQALIIKEQMHDYKDKLLQEMEEVTFEKTKTKKHVTEPG